MHTNYCYLCGFADTKRFNIDHILPNSICHTRLNNTATAHWTCNRNKSDNIILPKCFHGKWCPDRNDAKLLIEFLEDAYLNHREDYGEIELRLIMEVLQAYKLNTPIFDKLLRWEWVVITGKKMEYNYFLQKWEKVLPQSVRILNIITCESRYVDMYHIQDIL